MADAAPDHLDDIRRARHVDSKVAAIEFIDDRLDATNQRPGTVPWRENDDVARFAVIRNQQPTPEWTLDRIIDVFGPIGKTADTGHGRQRHNLGGEPLKPFEVRGRCDIRRSDAQNELTTRRKPTVDRGRLVQLRIVKREEKLLIDVR